MELTTDGTAVQIEWWENFNPHFQFDSDLSTFRRP